MTEAVSTEISISVPICTQMESHLQLTENINLTKIQNKTGKSGPLARYIKLSPLLVRNKLSPLLVRNKLSPLLVRNTTTFWVTVSLHGSCRIPYLQRQINALVAIFTKYLKIGGGEGGENSTSIFLHLAVPKNK